MAAAKIGYRGNAIGISAGLGVALPLAAYAATISFDGVNDIVRMDAMPFAAGALAGVGMLALTGHMLDVHAERAAAERAEAERYASLYASTGSAAERAAQVARPAEKQSPAQTFIGKRFARQGQPDGVPVISRAVDALDEMEAWAEIDTMFSDDSPFSCDPARSKDMYQIALEELRRGESARAASTASAGASTAVAASAPAASRPMTQVVAPTADERQAEADRSDALASLYGRAAASRSYVPQMPTMTASAASQPVGAGAAASQAVATAPASSGAASDSDGFVPMADYSGHEDMWRAALAILENDVASQPQRAACVSQERAVSTGEMDARRMAAVAEGGNATRVHSHVNALIEEEFDKVSSKSVHSTAHEYLKVIEGGTAAMPALQTAEA